MKLAVVLSISYLTAINAFVIPAATTSPLFTWSSPARGRKSASGGAAFKAAPIASAVIVNEEETLEKGEEQFNWFKQWYPLTVVDYLDAEKPHKYQILGQDIVIWNDAPAAKGAIFGPKSKKKSKTKEEGTWRAFIDECPHRKVPLSEGRVEADGTLLCSYHGWRFEGESGSLVNVPQMTETELSSIQSNPKTQCNAFPTKVLDGILWVWPSSDENAVLESELTPVQQALELDEEDEGVWKGNWNFRELPYGQDFFVEVRI
jgi:phenylpropionate dioxygenase-like ring-hydroxylating dioxygenase large terminal subunit